MPKHEDGFAIKCGICGEYSGIELLGKTDSTLNRIKEENETKYGVIGRSAKQPTKDDKSKPKGILRLVGSGILRLLFWIMYIWASFTKSNNKKNDLLFYAVKSNDKNMTAFLLSKGANVNAKKPDGSMPLHYATSVEVAKILLANGADINAKNDIGTPLAYRSTTGNIKMVEFLISHGADVNATDEESGITPLHAAALSGETEIVEFLILNSAQINSKTLRTKKTPLDFAEEKNHSNTAKLLRKKGGVHG